MAHHLLCPFLAGGLGVAHASARVRERFGVPATQILAVAREEDADLIAMTTHGRSGVKRLFYGSVAEEVLRGAAVPILLVRGGPSG